MIMRKLDLVFEVSFLITSRSGTSQVLVIFQKGECLSLQRAQPQLQGGGAQLQNFTQNNYNHCQNYIRDQPCNTIQEYHCLTLDPSENSEKKYLVIKISWGGPSHNCKEGGPTYGGWQPP